jgi:hypothetical protein
MLDIPSVSAIVAAVGVLIGVVIAVVERALLEDTRERPCFCNIFAVTVSNSPLFSGISKTTV